MTQRTTPRTQPAPGYYAAPPMPQPTAEHKLLAEHAGTWKVNRNSFMEPGRPPLECVARETVELVGAFWTISEFESTRMGAPFVGRATVGYEPHSKRCISARVDAFTPALCLCTGSRSGDTPTMSGEVPVRDVRDQAAASRSSRGARILAPPCRPSSTRDSSSQLDRGRPEAQGQRPRPAMNITNGWSRRSTG